MNNISKKIKLGKIYRIEDSSGYAHYGMPYKAHKKKKKYDVYKFTTSKKKAYRLKENINPKAKSEDVSYVRKRPERVGDDFIHKEKTEYRIKNVNDKKTLRRVRKNKIKILGKK